MAWKLSDEVIAARPICLPAHKRRVGNVRVAWFQDEPGKAVILCEGGTVDDRLLAEILTRHELAMAGIKQASFSDETHFCKTAAWPDIMAKAKRLIQSGNVTLLRNAYNTVVAHVVGDHGEYQVEISRDDPQSRSITQWTCECPWDQYAFNRTRQWKKYEARPCAHVLAAYWTSQATPLEEDQQPPGTPAPMGQPGPPPSGAPVMQPAGPAGPPAGGIATPEGEWTPNAPGGPQPGLIGPQTPTPPEMGQMSIPGLDPAMQPTPFSPPAQNGLIPPYPMDPAMLQMPVSVPGGRPGPYPANPIQQPGTFSKMAQTGDPKLDSLIERYRKEFWNDAKSITPEEVEGLCTAYAHEFAEFLQENGVEAEVKYVGHPSELGYTDRTRVPDPDEGHAVVVVQGHVVDFAAAQYGYTDFPKTFPNTFSHVFRVAATSDKSFSEGSTIRVNEAVLGQSEGREGATDAGQWMEVPRNSKGEVVFQDPSTGWVEVIFPLKGGPMTSYHVRVFIEPEKLTPLEGYSPFQNPRRGAYETDPSGKRVWNYQKSLDQNLPNWTPQTKGTGDFNSFEQAVKGLIRQTQLGGQDESAVFEVVMGMMGQRPPGQITKDEIYRALNNAIQYLSQGGSKPTGEGNPTLYRPGITDAPRLVAPETMGFQEFPPELQEKIPGWGRFPGYVGDPHFPARMRWSSDNPHQAVLDANAGHDLIGLPSAVNSPGLGKLAFHSHRGIQQIADDYARTTGIGDPHPRQYTSVNPETAAQIAQAYEAMAHAPEDPNVKAAYDAMVQETLGQYQHAVNAGYTFEFYPPGQDPYPNTPREALMDLHHNKHMFVYPTHDGYGSSDDVPQNHPLLGVSPVQWNGQPTTYNDLFRGIHDFYGHAKEGVGFRADGEDNAFRQHAAMFSPLARQAMASETRGQNSWVNFGPHGLHNQTARTEDTVFSDQKAGLLPTWTMDPELHNSQQITATFNADHDPDGPPLVEANTHARRRKKHHDKAEQPAEDPNTSSGGEPA